MDITKNTEEKIDSDKELSISETEQQWIKDITADYFGINQRVTNLLKELNEVPYKQKFVNEKIREVTLNDLWFYKNHTEADKGIRFIINLLKNVVHKELNCQSKKRFLDTVLEFIKGLYAENSEEINYDSLNEDLLIFLEEIIYKDKELRIYSSSFLKKIPLKIFHNNLHLDRLQTLLKAALQDNLDLWKNALNFANWCNNKDNQFYKKHKNAILQVSNLEKEILNQTKEKLTKAKTWEELSDILDFEGFINEMQVIKEVNKPNLEQIYFIFYLLEMPEKFI